MSKKNKIWFWLVIFAIVMILVLPILDKLKLNSPQEFKDSEEQDLKHLYIAKRSIVIKDIKNE